MTILYVNVCRARDAAVLCEASDADLRGTNVAQVTTQLLEHLRDHPGLIGEGDCRTFVQRNEQENGGAGSNFLSNFVDACYSVMEDVEALHEDHFFHLYLKDEVYYACLSDDPDIQQHRVNFHFLQHVQEEFTKLYRSNRISTARAYSLDNTFAPVLRSAMHYHNLHHKDLAADAKVQAIQSQVESLQAVMGRNIRLVLDNQRHMEKLLQTSEVMREDARVFRRKSRRVLQVTKRKNWCITIAVVVVVIVVIFLSVLGVCGMGFHYCRAAAASGGSNNSNYDGGQAYDNGNGGNNNNDDGNNNNGGGDNQQNGGDAGGGGGGGEGGRRRRRRL